jgi:hypothetical protein
MILYIDVILYRQNYGEMFRHSVTEKMGKTYSNSKRNFKFTYLDEQVLPVSGCLIW